MIPRFRAASMSASALRAGAPAARAVDLEVGDLDAAAGHLADANRLRDRRLERRPLVAHVRGVDAALVAGNARQLDDLARLRVGARHVLQAGRESHRPVRHRAPDERLHPVELGDRGVAVRRPHHFAAHRVVTDERREVHRRASLLDRRQRLADVERGRAAIARDDGRDAHADEVLGARLLDEVVGVGVDVDEAWRDDEPRGVNHLARVELRERADLDDASGPDRDVSPPRGRAGAVDDLPAGNQQVIARLDLAGRQLAEHDRRHSRTTKHASDHKSSDHHAYSCSRAQRPRMLTPD